MKTVENIRESIMTERIRMSQVRKAFGAGLDTPLDPSQAQRFYPACCEYLQAALVRLHDQDQRIIALLTPLVPETAREDQQILNQFQKSLDASRIALERLMAALTTYRTSNGTGQADFEKQARAFLEVFINILGARRHTSSHLEEQHFSRNDWAYVADANETSKKLEKQLFAAVKATAPDGADPDLFTAGSPPTPPG